MPISKTISGATILWKAIGGKLALQELLPKRPTEMVGHHCSLLQSHNGWCIDNVKVQLFHCQRSSPPSTLSLPSAYADSLFASRSASPRPRIGLPRYHPMLLWLPGAGPINMSARLRAGPMALASDCGLLHCAQRSAARGSAGNITT